MSKTEFQDLSTGSKTLILIEFSLFSALMVFSYYFNQHFNFIDQPEIPGNILTIYAIVFSFTTQLSMLSLGLYNPRMRENFRTIFRRLSVAFIIAYFICSTFSSLVDIYPIQVTLLACISTLGLAFTYLLRVVLDTFDILGFRKRNVLVLGTGERAAIIEKRMRRTVDRQNFNLFGFISMPGDNQAAGIKEETILSFNGESILSFVRRNDIDEIVVACDERRGSLSTDDLFACKIRGVNIIEILDFIERETGQVAVNLIYPSWVIYSNGFNSTNYLRNTLDWVLNAFFGLCILIVTVPFMLLAAIAIKLEDGLRAPVFYQQERVGMDGTLFKILKFRSMSTDAEQNGAVWSTTNDSRVTRTGAFLRKYRIDELPQLYNVFKGDMGFVGPRPERPEFVQNLVKTIPYYNQRHNVKPGLTGWAQLKYPYGATEEDARQKLHYDLYYIKHRSILLDLHILIRTAEVVLFGKGR